MKLLTRYRQQQLCYILVDILSSLLVWVGFLGFRWMVHEGKVFSVDTILIPMFDFYRPLVLYPIGCLIIYYLSGYYLRPIRKKIHEGISSYTALCANHRLGRILCHYHRRLRQQL